MVFLIGMGRGLVAVLRSTRPECEMMKNIWAIDGATTARMRLCSDIRFIERIEVESD
jgi:hypothetical protein